MTEKIKDYKDLRIWQVGMEIVKETYRFTKIFPKEDLYGLTSQIRRSAISIPSNVAEGFARYHNKEYKHFLYICLGSCAELETQIILAKDLKYMDEDNFIKIMDKINYVAKMTSNLVKKLTIN